MKLGELSEIISKEAKVDEASVRKTLKAAAAFVKEQIAKEERFSMPGLGSFIRKEGKEPGSSRILLKPFKEKEIEEA
jgi:nucleoid DNA-binding protein